MSKNETDVPSPTTESGSPRYSRFSKVEKARSTLRRLDKDDTKHADDRILHKGMINGNRPYNAARLKANGQAWRCNVNTREAESIRDMNAGAYWSMMNDVPAFIDVYFKDPEIDPTQSFLWGNIIAEEYTEMLKSWKSWHFNISLVIQEFLIPGIGGCHFKNHVSWMPKAVKRDDMRFKVSDNASPEDMGILFIRDSMSPHQLFAITENAKISTKLGWNVQTVREVLVRKYVDKDLLRDTNISDIAYERIQQMFKNGEYDEQLDELQDVNVVWLYVREPSGKFSEYIFVEDQSVKAYMFEKVEAYDCLTEVFVPFIYTIGDGDMGSVRGLGNRMFGMVEYSNRLFCGLMDGTWLASSMIVQNAGSNRAMTIERIGPITVIPADVKPLNTAFTPQFGQLAQMRQLIESMQNTNNGVYRRTLALPENTKQSATAEQNQLERDTQFSGQQVANFYLYWDMLHREIMKRLLKEGWLDSIEGYEERKEFIKNCKARGVPARLLKYDKMKIFTMQSIGGGSNMMKKISTQRIASMSSSFDEIGRQNALVDAVASETGYRRAGRYITNLNRNFVPSNDVSVAMLENNDIAQGLPVGAGVDQKHIIHAMTHLQPIMETVQKYQGAAQSGQPIDPRQLIPMWVGGLNHLDQHINMAERDPRYQGDIDALKKSIKQIAPIVKQAMRVAKQQNDAEQQQQMQVAQAMEEQARQANKPEDVLKAQKMQAEIQIKAQMAQADMEMKRAKAEQMMILKEQAAAQKLRIKEEDHQIRMRREMGDAIDVDSGVLVD